MKYVCALALSFVFVALSTMPSFTAPLQVRNMKATIYDDGKSCPGGCDAHVVFNPVHNGTGNAFDPSSSPSAPRRCVNGNPCRICFSADAASCITVTYRGGGPEVGRFDFTPPFFEENCPKPGMPAAFASVCRSAQPGMDRLKNQVNCIADPQHEKCRTLMESAAGRKAADELLYDECQTLGEVRFNRKYRDRPAMQRSLDCAYTKQRTGGGGRWRRLLDGACRPGNYVGKDGLDCCNGNLYAAALLHGECDQYFVRR
jgi:hypothetical protein